MDNAEEILQALEEFSKLKPKEIPKELDEYLGYVAKTGDPVYQWHLVKHLFHEKLANVIKEFYETSPTIDLPPCPNVDRFNYERLKTSLLERLDTFSSAPFTVQRICELLTDPRKQYNRVDKFMRAIEKNILVVSTREPGIVKRLENDQTETVLNGIPDNKLGENDDRIINVSSDNLQFSNSTDSAQIPVVLHACVIQEEIEISNSVSTSTGVITTETKSWCEVNESDKDINLDTKTDLPNSSETDVSTINQEPNIESPKSTNVVLAENEIKDGSANDTQSDNVLRTETIGSSMPDSPDSPEPSSSDNLCSIGNLSEEPIQAETSETENSRDVEVSVNEEKTEIVTEVANKESENIETKTAEEPIDELKTVINVSDTVELQTTNNIDDKQENELKSEEFSPESKRDDSSNDSYQIDSKASSGSPTENISQNDDDLTNNSEEISSDRNVTSEPVITLPHPESVETNNEELTVKEIEEENVENNDMKESQKNEEISCSVEEEASKGTGDEKTESNENLSIKEVSEVKEVATDDKSACGDTEVVGNSNEILDEICDEQERKEGSIIHSTTNISGSEVESEAPSSMSTVEDICVDQVSCSNEVEAMDVDESSNQQMITSECENESEPMDQSDGQMHS